VESLDAPRYWVDRLLSRELRRGHPLVLRRARMLAGLVVALSPFSIITALAHWLLEGDVGQGRHLATIGVASAGMFTCLAMLRLGTWVRLAGNLCTAQTLLGCLAAIWVTGGVHSPSLVWLAIVPVFGVIFAGRASGLGWALLSTASLGLVRWGAPSAPVPASATSPDLAVFNALLALAMLWVLVRWFDAESERALVQLAQLRDEAQAASRAKSAFVANTSHEIRTPLTAILGYTELLLEDVDRPVERARRVEWLETIQRNGAYLGRVLNDVLDLSRIESGRLELETVPVDPGALLRDVHELMNVQAAGKGLDLALEIGADLPPRIAGDPTRLRQVLVNLVGNAIRFTPHGQVRISAALQARNVERRLAIEVIDSGIGLTEEQIGRIFEPFTQADASTTRTHGGTGLGLSIAAALVERMGGSLSVRSAPGSGSVFRVELPVLELPAAAGAQESIAEAVLPRAGLRVLVAEDGPDNQRLIRLFLERLGCQVEIAAEGRSAVTRVLDGPKDLDLVLMDLQMPLLDGYAAARELRASGVALPIIALTAHAMSEERERCLAAGCNDYLSKPIDRAALAACLARHTQAARP
jgi:signal transduction histidine kinase/CheY-like chemotaxis protein